MAEMGISRRMRVLVAAFVCATALALAAGGAYASTDSSVATNEAAAQQHEQEQHEKQCLEWGFAADGLDCRVCDRMAEFLAQKRADQPEASGDATTHAEKTTQAKLADAHCRACCTDLAQLDLAQRQYERVVLEVCTCKFGRFPKVANFVHHHSEKHTRLEVKYMNARFPHLLFYDAEGEKKEEVSIASWDEDTISEFIVAKVKADAVSEATEDVEVESEEGEDEEEEGEAGDGAEGVEGDEEEDGDEFVEIEVSATG